MQDLLRAAISLHQAGDLAQAAALYQKVFASEPENAEAMHLLGVLLSPARGARPGSRADQPGRRPPAERCRRFTPTSPKPIGAGQTSSGLPAAARRRSRLKPDYPEALANLGLALQAMGRRDEAAEQFRRAIEQRPGVRCRP